ncbi:MAG TPA: crosslink repair DNA glycosylase YcaQ family protein, partial [Anaerolineales bacterium]|nr:crosslink repair DNA glycosylase YcaQ family protein [Anaerolineales bacterium]
YEALLKEGALNTLDLRRAAKLANARESEFNKALEVLQSDFKILPVGVSEAGAWRYSFIYEIVSRHYPDLPEKARFIGESEARRKLVDLYFDSVGATQEREVNKLFGWPKELTARTINSLLEKRKLVRSEHPKAKGEWLILPELSR